MLFVYYDDVEVCNPLGTCYMYLHVCRDHRLVYTQCRYNTCSSFLYYLSNRSSVIKSTPNVPLMRDVETLEGVSVIPILSSCTLFLTPLAFHTSYCGYCGWRGAHVQRSWFLLITGNAGSGGRCGGRCGERYENQGTIRMYVQNLYRTLNRTLSLVHEKHMHTIVQDLWLV